MNVVKSKIDNLISEFNSIKNSIGIFKKKYPNAEFLDKPGDDTFGFRMSIDSLLEEVPKSNIESVIDINKTGLRYNHLFKDKTFGWSFIQGGEKVYKDDLQNISSWCIKQSGETKEEVIERINQLFSDERS